MSKEVESIQKSLSSWAAACTLPSSLEPRSWGAALVEETGMLREREGGGDVLSGRVTERLLCPRPWSHWSQASALLKRLPLHREGSNTQLSVPHSHFNPTFSKLTNTSKCWVFLTGCGLCFTTWANLPEARVQHCHVVQPPVQGLSSTRTLGTAPHLWTRSPVSAVPVSSGEGDH